MENNKKESKFFKFLEDFEEVYGIKGNDNYKNIKKNQVLNVAEILNNLKTEELKKSFENTCAIINNDELVKDFWNILVQHEKYSKCTLGVFDNLDPSNFMNWAGITFSALLAQNILTNAGKQDMGIVAGMVALGFDGVLFANVFYRQPMARRIEEIIDYMQIKQPELYDIALVYNDKTRADIDTSEYDGKERYQKIHEKWVKYCEENNVKTDLEINKENSNNEENEFKL